MRSTSWDFCNNCGTFTIDDDGVLKFTLSSRRRCTCTSLEISGKQIATIPSMTFAALNGYVDEM